MQNLIYEQTKAVIKEFIEKTGFKKGNIFVVGCSTSEILGAKIGTNSSIDAAKSVFKALNDIANEYGIYLAFQCCEHLNRAIVTEKAALPCADEVNVVPQAKAGGSLATVAYRRFKEPIVVEEIKADGGIDIGLTFIGMHLKKVAVPLRLENNKIGEALVTAARTRPKFIGGERAVYAKDKM